MKQRPPVPRKIFYVDKSGSVPVYRAGELGDRAPRNPVFHKVTGISKMLQRMRVKQQIEEGKAQ